MQGEIISKVYVAMSWIMMPPFAPPHPFFAIFLLSEIGVFNRSALAQTSAPEVHCHPWREDTAHCTVLVQDAPMGGYIL